MRTCAGDRENGSFEFPLAQGWFRSCPPHSAVRPSNPVLAGTTVLPQLQRDTFEVQRPVRESAGHTESSRPSVWSELQSAPHCTRRSLQVNPKTSALNLM